MDDLILGRRNKRGDFALSGPLDIAARRTGQWGRRLWGHVWPYNAIFVSIALVYWYFILHDVVMMQSFSWKWMLKIHIANSLGITAVSWHLACVVHQTKKGARTKDNARISEKKARLNAG